MKIRFALLLLLTTLCQAQQHPYALRGTLVMPDALIDDGIVYIRDGLIVDSGTHITLPADVPVINTHGIIAPGFIDLHNHLTWNLFPRWKPAQEFGNRYDWQQKAVYQATVSAPHEALAKDGLECEMSRYAAVKALTEGETSVVGSLQQPCAEGLTRNLDHASTGPATSRVFYNVFPLQMTEDQLTAARHELSGGEDAALLIHLAEGAPNDASATREFAQLKGRGLLLPGVSLIHGVSLKPADFADMAQSHVGLIWSPRSNIELYGDTADVASAKAAGVTIALAPDWSITGSDGTLAELTYASLWNQTHGHLFSDRDLVRMATVNAAQLSGNAAHLGSLEPGHIADLLVITPDPATPTHDAWWTLTHASPAQVALLTVAGQPLYGDAALLREPFVPKSETLEVCGTQKALVLTGPHAYANASDEPWAATFLTLTNAMRHYGRKLAPLSECGN